MAQVRSTGAGGGFTGDPCEGGAAGAVRGPRLGPDGLIGLAPRLKAVFCDLDGTFLDGDHRVPEGAEGVVDRLQASGVRFVPATGRTPGALREFFSGLADRIDTVACNGMHVACGGRVLRHVECDRADVERLLDACRRSERDLGLVVFGDGEPYIMDMLVDFTRSCVGSLGEAPVAPLEGGVPTGPVYKCAVVALSDGAGAAAELTRSLGDAFDFACCGDHWIDISVHGINKIDGIRTLMAELGADPDEVAAFGDSMNDLAMLEALPVSVCVSNAMPAVKRACTFEIGSNRDNAVLACLDAIARSRGF